MKKLLFAGLALLFSNLVFSQKITGKITNSNGVPLPSATVWVLETKEGTISDEQGDFMIALDKSGAYTLRISFVGYETASQTVETGATEPIIFRLQAAANILHELTVTAVRAGEKAPFTYTNMSKEELQARNLGQDVPYLLDATPSVVTTSDAGAGIGYTGIRIRGTDPSRINVTINGVPINDAESQGMYWVDLPDVAASTESIQIQRGVGTSTNGSGAFGASINLNTDGLELAPYGEFTGTIGSFSTGKSSLRLGTGLFGKKAEIEKTGFVLDARGSIISSKGYIDRASSDLKSVYFSPAYIGKKFTLRGIMLHGDERTYQAWYGLPAQYLEDEPTYNPAGTEKAGSPYKDQVDDYRQTHMQLVFNQEISKNWNFSLTGHYTRGLGYYEEYKAEQHTWEYGILVDDDFPPYPDIVRRRWLDNHFFGLTGYMAFLSDNKKLQTIVGGGWNQYLGEHYGKVVETPNIVFDPNFRYYHEKGDKRDGNVYLKTQYELLPNLSGFVDMQVRQVDYEIGIDNVFSSAQPDRKVTTTNYLFFNPKAGLFYEVGKNTSLYTSFAVAQKEPNRDDFTDAPEGKTPKAERLFNTEAGMKYSTRKLALGVNFYHMLYKDQLVLTGNINDTGAPIRINVPDSYRMGIECSGKAQLGQHFMADANATFSQNKIKDFTEFVDDWDTGDQASFNRGTTDIAFSPNLIAFGRLTWGASQNFAKDKLGFSIALAGKHVGKQYLDNTSNENTVLDAYTTFEAQVRYVLQPSFCQEISFNLLIQNLLDAKYSSNGWTYRYLSSEDYTASDPYTRREDGNFYNLTGYFPQAGVNFLLGATIAF